MAKHDGAFGPSTDPKTPDFEWVPLDRIHPWPDNPRVNARAVKKVADSIEEFGWVRSLVANTRKGLEGELIIGHTARLAAILLGHKLVPVRWRNMTAKKAHAAAIADNKLNEVAPWDTALLGALYGSEGLGDDLWKLAGFSQGELDRLGKPLVGGGGNEEPAADPTTKLGDLWQLGAHRLICGDSTDVEVVARVLGGEPEHGDPDKGTPDSITGGAKPYLLVTDPPYGVEYDPSWRDKALLMVAPARLGAVENDDRADWTPAWQLAPCAVCYVWHAAGPLAGVVQASLEATGFILRPQIIWVKSHFPMGRGSYHVGHEPCWFGVRKGKPSKFVGGRKQSTVWQIAQKSGFGSDQSQDMITDHSTQKPLECMGRPIRNHEGDVYDPFLGSGTTLIAAEQLDRTCYGCELSPGYCDLIVDRWQKLTGETATRAG